MYLSDKQEQVTSSIVADLTCIYIGKTYGRGLLVDRDMFGNYFPTIAQPVFDSVHAITVHILGSRVHVGSQFKQDYGS
jgi:hypothetical protein